MTASSPIRRATLDDLEPVAQLFDAYRQFYRQSSDAALARRFLAERLERDESVVLVATGAQQQLIGFCQMYPSFCSIAAAPIVCLSDLFVTPAARHTGAGRRLMQAAQAHAAQHGYIRLDLTTAKTNSTAQALYESLGWQRDEVYFAYSKASAVGEPSSPDPSTRSDGAAVAEGRTP